MEILASLGEDKRKPNIEGRGGIKEVELVRDIKKKRIDINYCTPNHHSSMDRKYL